MSQSVNLFVASDQELTDFVAELSRVFQIEFYPHDEGRAYQFRNGVIALTVRPHNFPELAVYRYHLAVTSDTLGTPQQRTKWAADWGYDFYQAIKATGRYRLRRLDNVLRES